MQSALLNLTAASDSLARNASAEKIYIQFDKPAYVAGDTIWFKAYLFNAPSLLLSAQSGILHVDIASDSNRVVKQYIFPISHGVAWGDIPLNEKDFKPADYRLRAYTNWMQNFGENLFYYTSIRIAGANENGWLVRGNTTVAGDKMTAHLMLQLKNAKGYPVADSLLRSKITNGKKNLFKQDIHTDKNGLLDFNFPVPPKTGNLNIVLENATGSRKAVVPVRVNRPENTDVQFFAEGGSLIIGLRSRIGFKAIGEDGHGVDINGAVLNKDGKPIVSFRSTHNGMGSFEFQPETGESYTARVTLSGSNTKDYPLPAPKLSGISLRVDNTMGSDSLAIALGAAPDIIAAGNHYFLVAKARGLTCYAAVAGFEKGSPVNCKIAKSLFPSGITHFIVTTPEGRPLNERLVYIDHHDALSIDIEPGQDIYATKDSVALHIRVRDAAGQPVAGNFSLAVTDDTQVRPDTSSNIITRLLLTSDLQGYVEDPGYYLKNDTASWSALDNLLLTQGWVSYEPSNHTMPFKAEKEFTVSGRVNNVFSKPVKKTEMVLLSKSPAILMDTMTNNEGRFTFDHFPRVDTPVFILKTNKRNFNVNIAVDAPAPPVFQAPKMPWSTPWYVNTDTTLVNSIKSNAQMQLQKDYIPGGGKMLKEVKITAKKIVKGSENLNGPGNADLVLDEKDMEQAGKKTLLQLFQENIKGFREGAFISPGYLPKKDKIEVFEFESSIRHAGGGDWFFIIDKPVILIMDGVDIEDVILNFKFQDFMDYLKSHTAEDVKGIEVNFSSKYTGHYLRQGKWITEPLAEYMVRDFAFVEVTTRSGHGALIKYTPGVYLHKPLALSWPRQFYKPRYTVNDTSKRVDLRPTVDWEPNISTDVNGNATVSFFAGSEPSTYTIITEGTDLNGNIGSVRKKPVIKRRKEAEKSK